MTLEEAQARIERLESALQPFAQLGYQLAPVDKLLGTVAAGDSARSSVCWNDFERAAKAFYGELREDLDQ